jgi:hypothetical protein
MRARTAYLLAALGVAAITGQTDVLKGKLMFPGLAPRLRSATRIEIVHQGAQLTIRKTADGHWGVASMRDYPVQEAKLRTMLIALTELRLTEPRTRDPAQFGRLGVDDPQGTASSGDLLRVLDDSDKPILELIVGHRRIRPGADLAPEVYVRRPNEPQSWLAEGNLQVDADAAQWLDRNLMNIGHDRIASVRVGDGALVFGRQDGRFTLTQPADHPKLADYKVDGVARALELLTFQSVKANTDADTLGTEVGHSEFDTSDGLAVTVHVFHADKDVWARFTVTGSDKVKAEADRLSARLAGWTYQIGSWKEQSLVPAMDDLKAEKPEPDPVKK